MPNQVQFISRETNEPEKFFTVDDKIRVLVGAPPDAKNFYRGWYHVFGEEAAMGWSFQKMIDERPYLLTSEDPEDIETLKMLRWLDEHYTINAWYAPK